MPVPQLTDEQRLAALAKAREARKIRADVLERLRNKEITVSDVIEMANTEESVKKLRVLPLICTQPSFGKVKAERLMSEIGIASNRTVGGLGRRQREDLILGLA